MTVEEIKKLSDEELEKLALTSDTLAEANKQISDKDAEIASLKKELEANSQTIESQKKELAETKELNFTLARQFKTSDQSDIETTIHNMFNGKE